MAGRRTDIETVCIPQHGWTVTGCIRGDCQPVAR